MELCTLIVNYLPHDMDDVEFKRLFEEHGDVTQAIIAKNKQTGESLTYGFVKYTSPQAASSAILGKNGFQIGKKKLKVSLARRRPEDIQHRKLFVSKLPISYTQNHVRNLFLQYGEIVECRLLMEAESKTSRGSAFVEYCNASDCASALSLNGKIPSGGTRPLKVQYARPPPIERTENSSSQCAYQPLPCPEMEVSLPCAVYSSNPESWTRTRPHGITTEYFTPASANASPMYLSENMPSPISMSVPIPTSTMVAPSPVTISPMSSSTGSRDHFAALCEHFIEISGLPPFVNVGWLLDIFSPAGSVLTAGINVAEVGNSVVTNGLGWVRIFSIPEYVDAVVAQLHGYSIFPAYPPLQVRVTRSV